MANISAVETFKAVAVEAADPRRTMTKSSMLIAVASDDDLGLDGQVCAHFGHCPVFTIVEVKDGMIAGAKVVDNPHARGHAPGTLPEYVESLGAKVILAGGMGGRAVTFFQQYGIEACAGYECNVRQAVESYLDGDLGGGEPCPGHHGGD